MKGICAETSDVKTNMHQKAITPKAGQRNFEKIRPYKAASIGSWLSVQFEQVFKNTLISRTIQFDERESST